MYLRDKITYRENLTKNREYLMKKKEYLNILTAWIGDENLKKNKELDRAKENIDKFVQSVSGFFHILIKKIDLFDSDIKNINDVNIEIYVKNFIDIDEIGNMDMSSNKTTQKNMSSLKNDSLRYMRIYERSLSIQKNYSNKIDPIKKQISLRSQKDLYFNNKYGALENIKKLKINNRNNETKKANIFGIENKRFKELKKLDDLDDSLSSISTTSYTSNTSKKNVDKSYKLLLKPNKLYELKTNEKKNNLPKLSCYMDDNFNYITKKTVYLYDNKDNGHNIHNKQNYKTYIDRHINIVNDIQYNKKKTKSQKNDSSKNKTQHTGITYLPDIYQKIDKNILYKNHLMIISNKYMNDTLTDIYIEIYNQIYDDVYNKQITHSNIKSVDDNTKTKIMDGVYFFEKNLNTIGSSYNRPNIDNFLLRTGIAKNNVRDYIGNICIDTENSEIYLKGGNTYIYNILDKSDKNENSFKHFLKNKLIDNNILKSNVSDIDFCLEHSINLDEEILEDRDLRDFFIKDIKNNSIEQNHSNIDKLSKYMDLDFIERLLESLNQNFVNNQINDDIFKKKNNEIFGDKNKDKIKFREKMELLIKELINTYIKKVFSNTIINDPEEYEQYEGVIHKFHVFINGANISKLNIRPLNFKVLNNEKGLTKELNNIHNYNIYIGKINNFFEDNVLDQKQIDNRDITLQKIDDREIDDGGGAVDLINIVWEQFIGIKEKNIIKKKPFFCQSNEGDMLEAYPMFLYNHKFHDKYLCKPFKLNRFCKKMYIMVENKIENNNDLNMTGEDIHYLISKLWETENDDIKKTTNRDFFGILDDFYRKFLQKYGGKNRTPLMQQYYNFVKDENIEKFDKNQDSLMLELFSSLFGNNNNNSQNMRQPNSINFNKKNEKIDEYEWLRVYNTNINVNYIFIYDLSCVYKLHFNGLANYEINCIENIYSSIYHTKYHNIYKNNILINNRPMTIKMMSCEYFVYDLLMVFFSGFLSFVYDKKLAKRIDRLFVMLLFKQEEKYCRKSKIRDDDAIKMLICWSYICFYVSKLILSLENLYRYNITKSNNKYSSTIDINLLNKTYYDSIGLINTLLNNNDPNNKKLQCINENILKEFDDIDKINMFILSYGNGNENNDKFNESKNKLLDKLFGIFTDVGDIVCFINLLGDIDYVIFKNFLSVIHFNLYNLCNFSKNNMDVDFKSVPNILSILYENGNNFYKDNFTNILDNLEVEMFMNSIDNVFMPILKISSKIMSYIFEYIKNNIKLNQNISLYNDVNNMNNVKIKFEAWDVKSQNTADIQSLQNPLKLLGNFNTEYIKKSENTQNPFEVLKNSSTDSNEGENKIKKNKKK